MNDFPEGLNTVLFCTLTFVLHMRDHGLEYMTCNYIHLINTQWLLSRCHSEKNDINGAMFPYKTLFICHYFIYQLSEKESWDSSGANWCYSSSVSCWKLWSIQMLSDSVATWMFLESLHQQMDHEGFFFKIIIIPSCLCHRLIHVCTVCIIFVSIFENHFAPVSSDL